MKKLLSRLLVFVVIINLLGVNNKVFAQENTRIIETRGLSFRSGMSSDEIRLLKDYFRLTEENVPWGYLYDARTKELVSNFQKKNNIKVDGVAGKTTIEKINQDIKGKKYALALRSPYTNLKGDMIIINKSSNTLYHLKDGEVYKAYPVATGKESRFTPDGKHKIVVKYKNPAWGGANRSQPIPGGAANNPLGKRWIGISYGGGSKYGVHGNSNANSIGTYSSLGCVRMFNGDVEKLYEEVGIGTPVWIGEEETLIKYGVDFKYLF